MKTKTAWWWAVALLPVLASAQSPDKDGDGVPNEQDDCPYTAAGAQVDRTGCALDEDFDGVADGIDRCPATGLGASVDVDGCAKNQTAARPAQPAPAVVPPPAQPAPAPASAGVDPFSVRDAAVEAPSAPAPAPVAAPEPVVPEPVVPAPEAVAVPEPVAPEPDPALPVVIFPEPAAVPPLPDEVRTSLGGGALLKVPKLRAAPVAPAPVPAAPEAAAAPVAPAAPERNVVTEPIFYGGRRVTVATMVPRAAVPLPAPAPVIAAAPVVAATGPWTLNIAKSSELSTANQTALNDIVGAVLNGQLRYEIAGPASQAALARSYLVAQGVPGERLQLKARSGTAGPVEIRAAN